MGKDQVSEFIERADEIWLDNHDRTNEQKAEAFDILLLDFCILIGMLKVFHVITREPTSE